MTYPILKDPEFLDLNKTTVRVKLQYENGSESIAQLKVPENQARGVNNIWDRILDEFDVEEMRQNRNNLEARRRREAEFQDKKRKAAVQSDSLRQLFDKKMGVFNLPFMANATSEEKAAVRRAPNDTMLYVVVASLAQKYIQEGGMTFVDLFDQIDDIEYQAQLDAQAQEETTEEVDPTTVADTSQLDQTDVPAE